MSKIEIVDDPIASTAEEQRNNMMRWFKQRISKRLTDSGEIFLASTSVKSHDLLGWLSRRAA